MMAVRQTDGLEEAPAPLPPESAAAHFEAIAKGINDVDVVIQGLIGRIRPAKPWQRQLLQQLRTVRKKPSSGSMDWTRSSREMISTPSLSI